MVPSSINANDQNRGNVKKYLFRTKNTKLTENSKIPAVSHLCHSITMKKTKNY